jgi:chitinase
LIGRWPATPPQPRGHGGARRRLLVTASCSARVSTEQFYDAMKEAAFKVRVELQLVEERRQPPDHVGDCVLGGNGWAYLFPRVDQWVALHSVEMATGVEVNTGSIYAGDRARLNPADPSALYVVTAGLSPAQIYRWDVSSGAATYKWESPYWGDHAMGPELWFSPDGTRLFTAAGTAYRTSSTQSQDIIYGGQLSGLTSVKQLDCSNVEVAAIPATSSWDPSTTQDDTTVELFNTTYLGHVDRISLPWWSVGNDVFQTHGLYVFHSADGAKKYVIVQADGSSGLLLDTAVLNY